MDCPFAPVQQPIAIVGIAAEFPSGTFSPDNFEHTQFFDFLLNKGEAYEKIPLERFNIDSYYGREAGQVSTQRGTFLKATDMLDHLELGITNKDAKSMSLSTRKLIQLSFLALLDSGIDYRSRNIGCFTSGIMFDILSLSEPDEFEAKGSFGGPPAMIANRISYHLDLTGPSVPVDTACSSSLTATHLAVQAIRAGDCDAAVVGGIQLNHRFVDWVQYSQGGILAPDGKCKPFDASADGFSRGEAGVVIVLKRLDQALKDKDHIYATILGTGINSSGSAAPVNAPVGAAQRDSMRRAWAQTGRTPAEVDYIELHATGTAAGDPTEANWVGDAFRRDDQLMIGSVKGNIGHTEIAAFLASLAKVINIFRTGTIPPNVNFSTPNPAIKWDEYRLHVPTNVEPLPCRAPSGKSLVALCSSGIGGSNGHVVLESPPPASWSAGVIPSNDIPEQFLFVAGGLSPRTTAAISEGIASLVASHPTQLPLISTLYGRRARQMTWRSYATYTHGQRLKFSTPTLVPRVKPSVVFVFAGQGPQHLDMGRELFHAYPVFRSSILEMDKVYSRMTGTSLIASTGIFSKCQVNSVNLGDIWPISVTLPALAMLQCALVDLLASLGVTPDLVLGHSAGETAIFYASGAGSKEMAIEIAIARGCAMALVEESGGSMAALSCGISEAAALITELGATSQVDIACHNSQDAVTIAGPSSALDGVIALAESRGIMGRKLRTRVSVHSHVMEECRDEYSRLIEAVWARYPGEYYPLIPVYSTVTGKQFTGPFTAEYYWRGTRDPVLFAEAVGELLADHSGTTCIEITPHPVLGSYLSALGLSNVVSPLRRPKRNERGAVEVPAFLDCLGRFTTFGHNAVNFSGLNGHPVLDPYFPLPAYPFNPKPVAYHSESASFHHQFQIKKGPLNYSGLRVNAQTHPVLAQHVIKGEPIMPAAGFLEMALEFGAMVLWDVEFHSMMSLSAERPTPVQVALDGIHWTVKTSTASAASKMDSDVFDKVHAEGYLSLNALDRPRNELQPLDLEKIQARCKRIDLANFYEDLKTFAEYGPAFQRVIDGYQGKEEVLVLVRGPDDNLDIEGYCFHPAILDCCLHFMVHNSFTLSTDNNIYYLPSKVGQLIVHSELVDFAFPDYMYTHIVFKKWTPSTIVADFHIVSIDGTRLCTLYQVEVERHQSSPNVAITQRYDVATQPVALPVTLAEDQDFIIEGSDIDMNEFHKYLDYLAIQTLRSTLEKQPATGTSLDRKRYLQFATAVSSSPISQQSFNRETVREFERKYPEMMEITNRLSSVHARIFESSKTAVEVLYKDDIMTRFYQHYDWASKACADRLRSLLSSLVKLGKRVIRVLEVGSGTGALTRHLVEVMNNFPSAIIEFVVSDVSKELLPRMPYPRCQYKSFDISKPAEKQGFGRASFDIITGFDVLHVVPEMGPALAELNGLLVPGGNILIGDLNGKGWETRAPGSIWFDFVFGSFAEWFSFTDNRSHCSMSSREWRKCLGFAGFGKVVTTSFARDPLLFMLEAQKIGEADTLPRGLSSNAIIFQYHGGNEGELRTQVMAHNALEPLSLWLFSSAGFDSDAGTGLSRALGREYALWDVHFVTFDRSWSEERQRNFVYRLSCTSNLEAVLLVDVEGNISVPRVVPSPSPSRQSPFDPSLPWTYSSSGVVQISNPPLTEDLVTLEILAISSSELGFRGFVGRVTSPVAGDGLEANGLVVGVTYSPKVSNFVTIQRESVASLPPSAGAIAKHIAGYALGVVIGSISCGASSLLSSRRRRRQRGKALLSHIGAVLGPSLKWFLDLLDIEVIELIADSPAEVANLRLKFDFIFSGSSTRADHQSYMHALVPGGQLFLWNDLHSGLPALLKDDPSAVGEALDIAMKRIAGCWPCNELSIHMDDLSLPEPGTLVPSSISLFDPAKAYVVFGGIGGLGIRIALWMYERGARYLILTSRSGRSTLTRVQDKLALRVVDYLESLPDFTLRLEASDATSHESTDRLLRSIPVKLGGCMLLTVVLSDRTFAFQGDDDFSKVFDSKIGACKNVQKCIPNGIASLDFFIAFSSVVGLFGNGGQTNYCSANTALDGIMGNWDNAFSFILPAISDGGGLASETREQGGRLGHLTPWGMSAQRICDCLEDGILKLRDGPFWQYIPDIDWPVVEKFMGSAPLYGHLMGSGAEEGPAHVAESGKSMQDIVIELLDVDASEFSADVPFTAYGLDSLSAARLSLALRPHVAISQLQLLSDVSLNDLHKRAEHSIEQEQFSGSIQPPNQKLTIEPRVAEIEGMISKYTRTFKKHVGTQSVSFNEDEVVLVTGTTGAIGTALLVRLASIPSVGRVYAFNRPSADGSSLRKRQAASLEARGYNSSILDQGKIVLVEGDQSAEGLGISSSLYDEIRDSVTSIIHNAWPVNFTTPLASFEPGVCSVRAMIDLALGSSRLNPPRLVFLSSIGLFYNRRGANAAPEERITDISQVAATGYSESKYVAERILEKAAEETTLRPTIVRGGQICGGLNGSWSTREWFPSLVKSSVHLQCLPEMKGEISWLPLQAAADALIDMRNVDQQTLHISHPRPIAGAVISDTLSKSLRIPIVPYSEWLSKLQKSVKRVVNMDANPALGLLDYFRSLEVGTNAGKEALGLPKLSVAEGIKASISLRDVKPLAKGDVELWVENWTTIGFLSL